MNMPLVILNRRRRGFTAFSPSTLFALAEPGVWFDPSDLTTLFQDPAGTTPVTAPGNTVGLMLDKSRGLALGAELVANGTFASSLTSWTPPDGNSNIDTSSGAAVFTSPTGQRSLIAQTIPTVAGKVYQVTFTKTSGAIANGAMVVYVWQDNWTSPTLYGNSYGAAAAGTYSFFITAVSSAVVLGFDLPAGNTGLSFTIDNISVRELPGNHATQATIAARPTYSIEPVGGRRNLLLNTDTLATQSLTVAAVAHTLAFTGTGTVTLSGASTAGPLVGTGAGNRVTLTFTPTAASLTLTVSGSVTLGQLELGSTATAYQRVTTQHDVTEAGVASVGYLYFDGVNDAMVTSTITPGTDKVQVFAGVRKLGNTSAIIAEFSAAAENNAGSFNFFNKFFNALTVFARGTTASEANGPVEAAPKTSVMTGLGDIAGDRITLRADGVQVAQSTADLGTGNFLAYPLYLGGRAGTSLFFVGHLYSLITRFGPTLDAPTIASTETWVAGKTGIVI